MDFNILHHEIMWLPPLPLRNRTELEHNTGTLEVPMHTRLRMTFLCMVLSVPVAVHAAQTPPVPANPIQAQTALTSNPTKRCPDLRIADEGSIAVVVFWLPRSGTPSQISIKTSSGSSALDSAAMSCVSRLLFAPATTIGTGDPIDAWQQIALRWAAPGNVNDTQGIAAQSAATGAPPPIVTPAAQTSNGGQTNSVTVHVCVDKTGTLQQDPTIVHSSGQASLDRAAVRIAASGSAYYRPDAASTSPSVSGCAQLTIRFELN
jgi:TonB family protein